MQFDLVTPSKLVLSQEVDEVIIPGEDGMFGVLDGHALVISTLQAGLLTVKSGEQETLYCVGGGLADVQPKNVTILADEIIKKDDIDVKDAEKSLSDIEAEMETHSGTESSAVILEKLTKKQAYFKAMLEIAAS